MQSSSIDSVIGNHQILRPASGKPFINAPQDSSSMISSTEYVTLNQVKELVSLLGAKMEEKYLKNNS